MSIRLIVNSCATLFSKLTQVVALAGFGNIFGKMFFFDKSGTSLKFKKSSFLCRLRLIPSGIIPFSLRRIRSFS